MQGITDFINSRTDENQQQAEQEHRRQRTHNDAELSLTCHAVSQDIAHHHHKLLICYRPVIWYRSRVFGVALQTKLYTRQAFITTT